MTGAHSLNTFNLNELYLYNKLKELNGDDEWEVMSRPGIMRAIQNVMVNDKLVTRIVEYDLRHSITVGANQCGRKWFVSRFSPSPRLTTEPMPFKVPMPFYDLEIQDEP